MTFDFLREELIKLNCVHEYHWICDYINKKQLPLDDANKLALEILERKKNNEPLAYIFGSWAFRKHEFYVGPGVLIPRPETEELVEHAIQLLMPSKHLKKVLDLGAGSGCIGLSLELELLQDNVDVTLVEKSPEAFAYLEKNKAFHKTIARIVNADWNSWAQENQKSDFDLIVSNPPYITENEYESLEESVKKFEPKTALVPTNPDSKAWKVYEELLLIASKKLKSGGYFLAEFGSTQAEALTYFQEKYKDVFSEMKILTDMASKPRFLIAKRV